MRNIIIKTFCCLFFIILIYTPAISQENRQRIAVFDPISTGTNIDAGTNIAIREIISSTVVNTGKHNIVERSLLEKVIEEQSFSNSGIVDENQATEIGKLAGANKIIVFIVTSTGGRYMLSIKLIDVKTASVEKQQVKVVSTGEIINVIEPMTFALINNDTIDFKKNDSEISNNKISTKQNQNKTKNRIKGSEYWKRIRINRLWR